jgi:outer membrane immunogenic protein
VKGGLAGFQGGYNWRFSRFGLFGIELDYDWAHIRGDGVSNFTFSPGLVPASFPASITSTQNIKGIGTVRARLGWLVADNWLLYGTGGFAFARADESASLIISTFFSGSGGGTGFICTGALPCFVGNSSRTNSGFTVGGGTEIAILNNVSLKAEYLFLGMNSPSLRVAAVNPGAGFAAASFTTTYSRSNLNIARVGINYHFGYGAPLVTRY